MCATEDEELCHCGSGDADGGLTLHSSTVPAPRGVAVALRERDCMAWAVPTQRRLVAHHPPTPLTSVEEASLLVCSGFLRKRVISDGPCHSWEGILTSECFLMGVAEPTVDIRFGDHSPLGLALRTGVVPAREQTEVT